MVTKAQQESNECIKICYICQGNIANKYVKDCKVRDNCHKNEYRCAVHNICKLKIVYQNTFMWFFTMDQTMIFISS